MHEVLVHLQLYLCISETLVPRSSVIRWSKSLSWSGIFLQILIKRESEDAMLESGWTTMQDIKLEMEPDVLKTDLEPIKEVSFPEQYSGRTLCFGAK